jgi:hypothetical protein
MENTQMKIKFYEGCLRGVTIKNKNERCCDQQMESLHINRIMSYPCHPIKKKCQSAGFPS